MRANSGEQVAIVPSGAGDATGCDKGAYNYGAKKCNAGTWTKMRFPASVLNTTCTSCDVEVHFVHPWKWNGSAWWEDRSWQAHRIPVDKISGNGSNRDLELNAATLAAAHNPNLFAKPFDTVVIENHVSLIKADGDWALDTSTNTLYLQWAKDPAGEEIIVPVAEHLVKMVGDGANRVAKIRFEGIEFHHTTYEKPNTDGVVVSQGSLWQRGGKPPTWYQYAQATPAAAIVVEGAGEIQFLGNAFRNLGGIGISVENDVKDLVINGNSFTDLADGAVLVGHRYHHMLGTGLDPTGAPPAGAIPNLFIDVINNDVLRSGTEYWASAAINAVKAGCLRVNHNRIRKVPHNGIALGYGWDWDWKSAEHRQVNAQYNFIEDYFERLFDGGAIYHVGPNGATSSSRPVKDTSCAAKAGDTSVVSNNYLKQNNPGSSKLTRGIQQDKGGRSIDYLDNVVDGTSLYWFYLNGDLHYPENQSTKGNFTNSPVKRSEATPWTFGALGWADATALTSPPQAAAQAIIDNAGLVLCNGAKATLLGTQGDDALSGTSGKDVIVGMGGNDSTSNLDIEDMYCECRDGFAKGSAGACVKN